MHAAHPFGGLFSERCTLAWSLLLIPQRFIVMRFAIYLTIVFALGAGESLTLLCQIICDRVALVDVGPCRHTPAQSPVLVSDDETCDDAGPPAIGEIRETHQDTAAGPRTSSGIVDSYEFPTVASGHAFGTADPPQSSSENRPLDAVLRI